jgi:Ca-activated chloride channel homolog
MSWSMRTLAFGLATLGVSLGVLAAVLGESLRHVVLAQPWWLLLLLLPLATVALRAWLSPDPATLRFTRKRSFDRLSGGFVTHLADLPDGLRFAAVCLLVIACARPQSTRLTERLEREGIDIAIALDLSESMHHDDLRPDRLTAAKLVIDDFVARRSNDRIALVAFGAHASTISPLTLDHGVLRSLIGQLRLGVMDGTETAIGAGLGVALNRLEESDASSKVIVLLTDGVHNASGVDPDSVAQKAADRRVRIYTVLMGRHGSGAIDPGQLERLAAVTEGRAYTAENVSELQTSFQALLDELEKSQVEGEQIRAELFSWLLWPALLLLVLDIGLRNTRLRRFP